MYGHDRSRLTDRFLLYPGRVRRPTSIEEIPAPCKTR